MKTIQLAKEKPMLMEIITKLRDKITGRREFKFLLKEYGRFGAYEIINRKFSFREIEVETPLGKGKGITRDIKDILIIPVLRAGLPMSEGVLEVIQEAKVGFIGAKRGPPPNFPINIYQIHLPETTKETMIILVDVMLATGETQKTILKYLNTKNWKEIILFTAISTEFGIENISKEIGDMKEITHFTGVIDPKLNEKGYIIPGLGDAGDRAF